MTKKEFIKEYQSKTGGTVEQAKTVVEQVFSLLAEKLASGNDVMINDFGKFSIVERSERIAINPQTKEKVIVPACKVVKFKVSKVLKEKVK